MYEECKLRYRKCANCYWQENCPLDDMDDEEIEDMKKSGRVNPEDYADFENCRSYFHNYCEYYTPFDDTELGVVEFEKELKERNDIYQELVEEQNS